MVLYVFVCSPIAFAQTACPAGVAPGSPQCGPSPAHHGIVTSEQPPAVRYVPPGKWIKTWGSIALDALTGSVGTSNARLKRKDAVDEALESCAKSGTKCETIITYVNQCVSLAWPSNAGTRLGCVLEHRSQRLVRPPLRRAARMVPRAVMLSINTVQNHFINQTDLTFILRLRTLRSKVVRFE